MKKWNMICMNEKNNEMKYSFGKDKICATSRNFKCILSTYPTNPLAIWKQIPAVTNPNTLHDFMLLS